MRAVSRAGCSCQCRPVIDCRALGDRHGVLRSTPSRLGSQRPCSLGASLDQVVPASRASRVVVAAVATTGAGLSRTCWRIATAQPAAAGMPRALMSVDGLRGRIAWPERRPPPCSPRGCRPAVGRATRRASPAYALLKALMPGRPDGMQSVASSHRMQYTSEGRSVQRLGLRPVAAYQVQRVEDRPVRVVAAAIRTHILSTCCGKESGAGLSIPVGALASNRGCYRSKVSV